MEPSNKANAFLGIALLPQLSQSQSGVRYRATDGEVWHAQAG